MPGLTTYTHSSGTVFKIYWQNSFADTLSNTDIYAQYDEIIANITPFIPFYLFHEFTIEYWDPRRSDIPTDIAIYAGLTWPHLNLIQINCLNTTAGGYEANYLAHVLSHEFGHWYAYQSGFNINDQTKALWSAMRANSQASIITDVELIAEDFRLFFGCTGTKDFHRGTYLQGDQVPGLKDYMLIWNKSHLYTEGKTFLKSEIVYKPNNFNYCSIELYENGWDWWNRKHTTFDKTGKYEKIIQAPFKRTITSYG